VPDDAGVVYRAYSSTIIDSSSRTFKPISLVDNPYRPFDLTGFSIVQGRLCNAPEYGVIVAISDGSVIRVWDVVRWLCVCGGGGGRLSCDSFTSAVGQHPPTLQWKGPWLKPPLITL
jgi:hypothetical protein